MFSGSRVMSKLLRFQFREEHGEGEEDGKGKDGRFGACVPELICKGTNYYCAVQAD